MTTTKNDKISIILSDSPPVRIISADWPTVAYATDHDGGHIECQARSVWRIRVREHKDGRRIVYGSREAGNGGQYAGWRPATAGYLIPTCDGTMRQPSSGGPLTSQHPDEDATVRAIRRVAGVIHHAHLADEAIADLPATELV